MDPEDLTRKERTVLAEANNVLAKVGTIVDRQPASTLSDRLRRFMEYGFNDLKVMFLTDASRGGDLDNAEIEERVRSDAFQRIGPPRAPRLRRSFRASRSSRGYGSCWGSRSGCTMRSSSVRSRLSPANAACVR